MKTLKNIFLLIIIGFSALLFYTAATAASDAAIQEQYCQLKHSYMKSNYSPKTKEELQKFTASVINKKGNVFALKMQEYKCF